MQLKAYYIDFESFVMLVLESDMYYCMMCILYCMFVNMMALILDGIFFLLHPIYKHNITDFEDFSLNRSAMVAA